MKLTHFWEPESALRRAWLPGWDSVKLMSIFNKDKEPKYHIFDYLNHKKVSLLVDNDIRKGFRESYVGVLQNIDDEWIYLDTAGNPRIRSLFIRKSMILSIWEY